MVTYEKLLRKPQVANGLIGMSLAEFGELYAEFESAYDEKRSTSQKTHRHQMKRQRAVGAGRKHKYAFIVTAMLSFSIPSKAPKPSLLIWLPVFHEEKIHYLDLKKEKYFLTMLL